MLTFGCYSSLHAKSKPCSPAIYLISISATLSQIVRSRCSEIWPERGTHRKGTVQRGLRLSGTSYISLWSSPREGNDFRHRFLQMLTLETHGDYYSPSSAALTGYSPDVLVKENGWSNGPIWGTSGHQLRPKGVDLSPWRTPLSI